LGQKKIVTPEQKGTNAIDQEDEEHDDDHDHDYEKIEKHDIDGDLDNFMTQGLRKVLSKLY